MGYDENQFAYDKNILDNLSEFDTFSYEDMSGRFDPMWRWVIDTTEDIEFARAVYKDMWPDTIFGIEEIYQWVKQNPERILYHS